MINVATALGMLFVLAAWAGMDPAALRGLGVLALAVLLLGVPWDLAVLLRGHRRKGPPVPLRPRPKRPIRPPTLIVDGSNVMHWNGAPSEMVLKRVIAHLIAKGERPHVYFDANVGYKLRDRYCDAQQMAAIIGIAAGRVTVVDKGTPADPILLDHAVRAGIRVLTNDRFKDWKPQFQKIGTRGFLVRGRWQDGTPILRL